MASSSNNYNNTKVNGSILILMMIWTGVSAQSNCITAILSLSPCISYVTGNSSAPPSSSCCSQLSNVVGSTPQCLCSLLNGGASTFGVVINQTLAALAPAACNLQTPPVSRCNNNAGNGRPSTTPPEVPPPATSPVGSKAPTTPPSESSFPTSGSKRVPSTTDFASAGSDLRALSHTLSFFLCAVSWALSSAIF